MYGFQPGGGGQLVGDGGGKVKVQIGGRTGVCVGGRVVEETIREGEGSEVMETSIERVGATVRIFPSTMDSDKMPMINVIETRVITIPQNTVRKSRIYFT
jgi:hypothetical protein